MDARSLKFIADACVGELISGSPEAQVARVCSDTRHLQPGDLFFALSGDRFDGHEYLAQAAGRGAAAVVAERGKVPANLGACAVIVVDNTRQALGRLATRYRADFRLPMIAVGGSNGKTTTKELVAAVLRQKFSVLWSPGSFNNEIGVPLTLLQLSRSHEAAVLEAGTNHPGELAPLLRMIEPGFGIITCIGREHLEFFGNLDGVAAEEGWLAELLPVEGVLFVNGNDAWAETLARRSRSRVVRVGRNGTHEWRAEFLGLDANGTTFRVRGPMATFDQDFRIRLLGRHQVINALFAVAVGAELGVSEEEVRQGLSECHPAKMRLEPFNWNGVCVLNDAYNANADSMIAALQTLHDMPTGGRRVAVLGDMAELGAQGPAAHEEVGRMAAQLGLDQLFAVGKLAGLTAKSARLAGLEKVQEFIGVEAVAEALHRFLKSEDVVLFKASRSARMEQAISAWQGQATEKV